MVSGAILALMALCGIFMGKAPEPALLAVKVAGLCAVGVLAVSGSMLLALHKRICKKCGKSYSLWSLQGEVGYSLCGECTKESRKTLMHAVEASQPASLAWTAVRDGVSSSPLPRPFPVAQFGTGPKLTYREATDCVAAQKLVGQFDFLFLCQSYFKPTSGRRGLGCLAALSVFLLLAAVVWGGLGISGMIPAMICWAIAGGVYLAVARSPKPDVPAESLPSFGKFTLLVGAGKKLFLLPLVASGQRFTCDTVLLVDLDRVPFELLRNGGMLSLSLSDGGQPLLLERGRLKGMPKQVTFETIRQQEKKA